MKIIQSKKFKEHMKAHEKDFIISWQQVINYCEENNLFDNLKKSFDILSVEFETNIGYNSLVKTDESSNIVYAKRIGRDIYTRFVTNINPEKTCKCALFLIQSRTSAGEYFFVTMFPGQSSFKEPEDKNIKSHKELQDCFQFWSNHALVFNKEIIDLATFTRQCPYESLYRVA